jgi:tRNA(Ile)-lysidine synthase
MKREHGRILRPILDLGRADVLAYLKSRNIPFCTDSTNADTAYFRNRVRRKLVPLLDECFPDWRKTLPELGETQGLVKDFLKAETAKITFKPEFGRFLRTEEKNFFRNQQIIREEALFHVLDRLDPHKGRRIRRSELRKFAARQVRAADLGDFSLRNDDGWVTISRKDRAWKRGFTLLIKESGTYTVEGVTIQIDKENLPLVLRPSYGGDCIVKGKKKLKSADFRREQGLDKVITAEDRKGVAAFIGQKEGRSIFLKRGED